MKTSLPTPRWILLAALATSMLATGCVKSSSKMVVNNDATATIEVHRGMNAEAFEAIAEYLEQMLENIPEGMDAGEEDPLAELEKLEKRHSKEKLLEDLKKTGIEVTSSKESEENGWNNVMANGKIKDVNVWIKAARKARAGDKGKDNPLRGMSSDLMAPRFFKTDQANIGEVVLMEAMGKEALNLGGPGGGMDPEQIPPGMEEMVEAQIDSMKQRFSLNEMSINMELTLPGKVSSTKGCKVDPKNDKKITFEFKGSNISFTGMKDMFGLKEGVSARFAIPEGCKLIFEDQPKKKVEAKKKKAEDKTEKKKGGLKIGDDGK